MSVRFVITGGEHAGKSSLIDRLERYGLIVLRESAIDVIAEIAAELGSADKARIWRKENMTQFQERVADKQARREAQIPKGRPVVLDRGLYDGFAYCSEAGVAIPDNLWKHAQSVDYTAAFILDTVEPFVSRHETGRTGSLNESIRTSTTIERIYRAFRIPTHRVEVYFRDMNKNILRRERFILDAIKSHGLSSNDVASS